MQRAPSSRGHVVICVTGVFARQAARVSGRATIAVCRRPVPIVHRTARRWSLLAVGGRLRGIRRSSPVISVSPVDNGSVMVFRAISGRLVS